MEHDGVERVETSGRRTADMKAGEPAYRFLGRLVHGVNKTFTSRDYQHQEKIPSTGGALVVANHISNYDPIVLGEALIWSGRWPRFLGKSELWKVPVVGFFARGCRQIPVERNTSRAGDSLQAARQAIVDGELVVIYPEGTVGTDPDGWPMTGRTGAARVALETRCTVIPVGQWGAQQILPGKKVGVPKFFPRPTVQVKVGDPLDLSDLYDHPDRHAAVRIATERMLNAITDLVAELRGETAPEDRYDVRKKTRVPKGTTRMPDEGGVVPPVQPGIV
ncbi:lysophospholipid acyltransferase family protein [Luteococcus sp. Sow4_B9]|uniref:lysophospholipid acyltransferase family protein n=1 Tax=Luteococcus sp. Sow4_B9 TaxID=3438792 RepID=UPI003F9DE949